MATNKHAFLQGCLSTDQPCALRKMTSSSQLHFTSNHPSSLNMPCARCKTWVELPSWQLCEAAAVNSQGIATLQTGEETQCSKSWNNWWFFLCDKCTQNKLVNFQHEQWQAFDSTDGKGIWWWNKYTEEWFLEQKPGNWTMIINSEGNPQWCHPDGRCFNAFQEPWRANESNQIYIEDGWQAFDDANGRGTWWWNKHTEDWFVESEPGDWTATTDPRDNQTFWLHKDGRYFCASIEPWLIDEQSDDSDKLLQTGSSSSCRSCGTSSTS